jgi:hypothetical protein
MTLHKDAQKRKAPLRQPSRAPEKTEAITIGCNSLLAAFLDNITHDNYID